MPPLETLYAQFNTMILSVLLQKRGQLLLDLIIFAIVSESEPITRRLPKGIEVLQSNRLNYSQCKKRPEGLTTTQQDTGVNMCMPFSIPISWENRNIIN